MAIRCGIPIDLFRKLNPRYMELYHDAYENRQKEQIEMLEYQAWMNGIYIRHSIASVFDSDNKYPEKPIGLFDDKEDTENEELTEEQKVQAQKDLLMKLQIMQSNFESTHPKKPATESDK